MKIRIIVYGLLAIILIAGGYYFTTTKPSPTGLAIGKWDGLDSDFYAWRRFDYRTVDPRAEVTQWPSTRISDIKTADINGDGEKEVIAVARIFEWIPNADPVEHAELFIVGSRFHDLHGWRDPRPHPRREREQDIVLEQISETAAGHFNGSFPERKDIFFIGRDREGQNARLMCYYHDGVFKGAPTPEDINSVIEDRHGSLPTNMRISTFKGIALEDTDLNPGEELFIFDDNVVDILLPIPPNDFATTALSVSFRSNQNFLTSLAIGNVNDDLLNEIVFASSLGILMVFRTNPITNKVEIVASLDRPLNNNLRLPEVVGEPGERNGSYRLNRHFRIDRYENLAIGDVDADRQNEIVFANGRHIYIYEVQGDRLVQNYDPVEIPDLEENTFYDHVLSLADLDNDDKLEICLVMKDKFETPLYIYEKSSVDNQWHITHQIMPPKAGCHFNSCVSGNLDNDNKPELVLLEEHWGAANEIYIYRNTTRRGQISFDDYYDIAFNSDCPTIADLDANGEPELIYGSQTNSLTAERFFTENRIEWGYKSHDRGNTWCYPKQDGRGRYKSSKPVQDSYETTKGEMTDSGDKYSTPSKPEYDIKMLEHEIKPVKSDKQESLFITSKPAYTPKNSNDGVTTNEKYIDPLKIRGE